MTSELEKALIALKRFLTNKLMSTGCRGYVIGLSGGIDSALSAALAVQAVTADKVLGILMPYRSSSENSVLHALELVEWLKIESRKIDISPMIDIYYDKIDDSNRLRAGNKMARERMSILFDIAQETGGLVLGTGNRTEISLGYTTWHGDSACSVNPLGQLYKSEVWEMSRLVGIPDAIIDKAPSADLWSGQTDEDEIGVTYDQIDLLLKEMIDNNNRSMSKLTAAGFDQTDISRVISLLNQNSFKRNLPAIAPLDRIDIPDHIQLVE